MLIAPRNTYNSAEGYVVFVNLSNFALFSKIISCRTLYVPLVKSGIYVTN